MAERFKVPESKHTGNIVRPIDTSYEILCAAERSAPKKAYFELLAQPALMIPYTFKEEIARRNKTPRFKLEMG